MASITTGLIEQVQIDSNAKQNIASTAYGECTTDASNAAKTVEMTGFSLLPGVTVHIKFIHENTADNPTLNINTTGAKPIVQYGTTAVGKTSETNGWQAGAVLSLTYDGTSWVRDQGYNTNTTYTHPTSAGNKHIPSGGSSGQFLGWSAAGTAKWVDNPDTDTHRPIQLEGVEILGNNTTALNFKAGSNIDITNNNGALTIAGTYDYTLPIAKYNVLGGLKPAYSSTGAVTLTTTAAQNNETPTIAARTTTANRYYAIEIDKNGIAYVNIPWTDHYAWADIQNKPATATRWPKWEEITDAPETATRWPKWNEITAGADALTEGNSDITDHTEILTSYATDNGFADTNGKGIVYKRDAIHLYNYIQDKTDTLYVTKATGITNVAWDATNTKLTKTINGNTTDIVTAETLKAAINVTAADLGLSKAMRFIGIATVAITDGSTTDPVISGYSTKTAGDVIIDKDSSREFVWSTTNKWELLGGDSSYKVTQTAVTTVTAEATEDTVFVSSVTQNENGEITVKTRPLDTSGTWEGNAVTATTATKLSGKPSLATSGTTQITVTAGGQKSSAFTVPYSTQALRLKQSTISALSSFTHTTDLIYAADGGGNTVTDKPTGVDAFGVLSYKVADGWYGQLLTSANTAPGLYWRAATTLSGAWKKVLDSDNTTAPSDTPVLAWNTESTVFTLNGNAVKIKTMAKPTYAFTDLTAHPTTLAGYGITDAAAGSHSHTLTIGNQSLSVSTTEQTWALHDILYNSTTIQKATSWDQYTPGVYYVASSSAFTGDNNPENANTNEGIAPYRYGQLIVSRAGNGGIAQFYISHQDSNNINYGIHYRTGWNNTYLTKWSVLLDSGNYTHYTVTKTGTGASGTWAIGISGNAATATELESDAPNTTAQFYRGDNTWSDTISGGTFKITNNNNTLTIGSTNSTQCHFSNSLNIPFYFNNSIELSGSLGTDDHPADSLYIGAQDDRSIYFVGTNTTDAMLTFLDNTIDNAGNGIKIEGSTAVLGAGKSATHLPVDANTGTLFLLSDGAVNVEAGGSTISNRIGIQITSAGNIIPVKAEVANTNAQNLGAVDNVWANVFATNFIGALEGNATSADRFSTARKLGVALGSTTAVTFNGSADQLSIPISGTLAVGHGGTGATSFTANSLIISGATTTSALTTRAIKNMTSVSHLGWTTAAAGIEIPTVNTLAYWNGQFKNGSSNLQYCKLGQFGDMATKTATDYVLRAGDTMLGMLTIKGLKGTSNVDYGTALPISGTNGQIFFQLSDPYYEIPAGGTTGQVLMKHSDSSRDVYWGTPSAGGILRPDTTTKYYVAGSSLTVENTNPALFNTSIYVENNVLFGAAWNDYAEYRQTTEAIEPGRCVIEDGTDALHLSGARMQAGAEIVSDTYGFAIGQTEKCNTPIAVTGRVLAYPYDDLDKYKPGTPVCSGPEGTVSVMTEEEARQYPWLIIGTVSAIPTYEEWGTNHIKINGRIWIRIR